MKPVIFIPGIEVSTLVDTNSFNFDIKWNAKVLVDYLGGLDPVMNSVPMLLGRKAVAGSLIGGIKETQEMLYFCREHNIISKIEIIKMLQY